MLIPVVPPPKELGVINSFVACPSSRPIWTSGRIPKITQDTVPLWTGIPSSSLAVPVSPSLSIRAVPTPVSTAEIRARRSKGTGLQSRIQIGSSYRTNILLASRIADAFRTPTPVRTVDPSASADALRDIAQGLVYEEVARAQSNAESRARLEEMRTKDITLYILQANYSDQKREANKLRASERLKIVTEMAKKSDAEREVVRDLLELGLAPYIMTNKDRGIFAREAERLQDVLVVEEEEIDFEQGVGLARDLHDDGEENEEVGVDHGDYGDRAALPEGRDYPEPALDGERPI